MNSSEIARTAGVSVRTLRHYHQVGLLPEPARRANGYRVYTVSDLVLVLRIRRLAELGIPLDEIGPMLASGERAEAVLDDLDRELADQIGRLAARREAIARLRAAGVSPDTPPDLAEALARSGDGTEPELRRRDHEMLLLLHHRLDDSGRAALAGLLDQVAEPDVLAAANALTVRFAALAPDAPEAEVERLAADFRGALGELALDEFDPVDRRTGELLTAYQEAVFNDAQRAVLDRLTE